MRRTSYGHNLYEGNGHKKGEAQSEQTERIIYQQIEF